MVTVIVAHDDFTILLKKQPASEIPVRRGSYPINLVICLKYECRTLLSLPYRIKFMVQFGKWSLNGIEIEGISLVLTRSIFFQRKILSVLVFFLFQGVAAWPIELNAAQYSLPPYTETEYNCTTEIGCCAPTGPEAILADIFQGQTSYVGRDLQQNFYVRTLYRLMREAFQNIADDIRNALMFTIASKGAMIDAQNFSLTMLALQKQDTRSMQSYTMSDQICRFGTLSRSLAQSQDKARIVQNALAKKMANRQTLQIIGSSYPDAPNTTIGRSVDKLSRFHQYRTKFCDPTDLGGALGTTIPPVCRSPNELQYNRDIDVTRTWGVPLTLDIDFSPQAAGTKPTRDEENIFALGSNLYAHDLVVNLNTSDLRMLANKPAEEATSEVEKLMQFRSTEAKRSVANNSFAALTAMKAAGSGGSVAYMRNILTELGLDQGQPDVDDLELRRLYAMGRMPSYHAQMDFLTRKLYQSPAFFANLMESPVNVERQQTALEAITLMQDRDIYESLRRSEMLLSTLLEVHVMREQDGYSDKAVK